VWRGRAERAHAPCVADDMVRVAVLPSILHVRRGGRMHLSMTIARTGMRVPNADHAHTCSRARPCGCLLSVNAVRRASRNFLRVLPCSAARDTLVVARG